MSSPPRNTAFTLKRPAATGSITQNIVQSPSSKLLPIISPNKRLKPQTPKSLSDRFIPNRQIIDFETCNNELSKNSNLNENAMLPSYGSSSPAVNRKPISDILTPKLKRMVDVFHTSRGAIEQSPQPLGGLEKSASLSRINSSSQLNSAKKRQITRILPTKPSRVLDAPDLLDDYYLNLLHWSANNIVAIALQKSVYLWNATTSSVDQLCELEEDNVVTSVQWSGLRADTLAIGTSDNCIQLWDVSTSTQIRNIRSHSSRVSSLSWNNGPIHGGNLLSSGSRDSLILHHDMRSSRAMNQYVGHEQEVCGLAWSSDGKQLASGGNENLLCIWDAAMTGAATASRTPLSPVAGSQEIAPRFKMRGHVAAVKALAWCPWEAHTLVSGGGTADRSIRIWNTSTGACLRTLDTGSQVCAMQFNDHHRELLSSHGFSDNQLILWKFPTMTKIKEFTGHTMRVLHMSKSPDGQSVCTASPDESLRFWDIFNNGETVAGRENARANVFGVTPVREHCFGRQFSGTPTIR